MKRLCLTLVLMLLLVAIVAAAWAEGGIPIESANLLYLQPFSGAGGYTAGALGIDLQSLPVVGKAIPAQVEGQLILTDERIAGGVTVALTDTAKNPIALGIGYVPPDGFVGLVSATAYRAPAKPLNFCGESFGDTAAFSITIAPDTYGGAARGISVMAVWSSG